MPGEPVRVRHAVDSPRPHDDGRSELGPDLRHPAGDRDQAGDIRDGHRRPGLQRAGRLRAVHRRRGPVDPRALRHGLFRPAWRGAVPRDPMPIGDRGVLRRYLRPGRPGTTPGDRDRSEDLRRCLYEGVQGGPGRSALLRHEPGDRGSRGVPRLPRRRQADALRRELRDAVRADLRGGPPRPDQGAVHRWPGGSRAGCDHVLRRGRAGLR